MACLLRAKEAVLTQACGPSWRRACRCTREARHSYSCSTSRAGPVSIRISGVQRVSTGAHLEVRGELDRADADVARSVVVLRLRVVTEARDDKGRLAASIEHVLWVESERGLSEQDSRDAPDGVVLRAGNEAGGVHQGEPGEVIKSAQSRLNERAGTHFWTKVIPATALRSSNRSMPYFHPYVEKIAR